MEEEEEEGEASGASASGTEGGRGNSCGFCTCRLETRLLSSRWRLSAYLVAEQDVDACGTLSVHLVDGSQRKVAHARHLADQFCGGELLEVKSVIHCDGFGGGKSKNHLIMDL